MKWETDVMTCPLCKSEGHGMRQSPAFHCVTYPTPAVDSKHAAGELHSDCWARNDDGSITRVRSYYTGLMNRPCLHGVLYNEGAGEGRESWSEEAPALWRKYEVVV